MDPIAAQHSPHSEISETQARAGTKAWHPPAAPVPARACDCSPNNPQLLHLGSGLTLLFVNQVSSKAEPAASKASCKGRERVSTQG